MVCDVKFISSNCKYRDVKDILQNTTVKTFPLVDSPGELCKEAHQFLFSIKSSLANKVSGKGIYFCPLQAFLISCLIGFNE